ncbi:hypothetical protein GMOD_00004697 [Pyrenophora seminiperda CCB06]|uniref:Uncharacterized protein n=1 Tax=Pyrenophora seminiperda CCB06 TaxID=1302712 RepID=A0A3M7MH94_9PLEO|nr:hypothetical protein GMOD_00004697 [Pyrenophora seminiperda CCB06]
MLSLTFLTFLCILLPTLHLLLQAVQFGRRQSIVFYTIAAYQLSALLWPERLRIDRDIEPPFIIFKPTFALHVGLYEILLNHTRRLPPAERAALLSGKRFAENVDSIIEGNPTTALKRLGFPALPPNLQERVQYVATLPIIAVTPPEDGDRRPERGQSGAKRIRYIKGLLAPPKRVAKSGREIKRRERALRKQSRELEKQ